MIVYREAGRPEAVRPRLARLGRLAEAGDAPALLLAAGHAFLASRHGADAGPHLAAARAGLARIERRPLPAWIPVRPPEGYVHYALDPAGYAAAAEAYARGRPGTRRARDHHRHPQHRHEPFCRRRRCARRGRERLGPAAGGSAPGASSRPPNWRPAIPAGSRVASTCSSSTSAWRARIPRAAGLPSCTVHERRKYLCRDGRGRPYILRYAGLGAWGDAVAARAGRLADAGAAPAPAGGCDGFIALPWVDGAPATPAAAAAPVFREALARYLAARDRAALRTGMATTVEPLLVMLETNVREALAGRDAGLAALRRLERLPAREAIIPDARLDSHERVETAGGYVKVDALDHGDGLRLPGPADQAWDLAGAAVELGLDTAATAELAARHASATGAPARGSVRGGRTSDRDRGLSLRSRP